MTNFFRSTPNEVRWVQGAIVILLDSPVDQKELVRQTDYALLQMMGKIKHRADGLPALRYSGWPSSTNATPGVMGALVRWLQTSVANRVRTQIRRWRGPVTTCTSAISPEGECAVVMRSRIASEANSRKCWATGLHDGDARCADRWYVRLCRASGELVPRPKPEIHLRPPSLIGEDMRNAPIINPMDPRTWPKEVFDAGELSLRRSLEIGGALLEPSYRHAGKEHRQTAARDIFIAMYEAMRIGKIKC